MRSLTATLMLSAFLASPAVAQEREGRYRDQGIPPGQLPPTGECRVWYDDRPPGHQPPPTSCREAERVASRDRYARVIYGGGPDRRDDQWWDRRERDRAIPRDSYPYPGSYSYPGVYPSYPSIDRYPTDRSEYGYDRVPFDNGYRDGYDKGRDDGRKHERYDLMRQSRFRSGDHGYDKRYGSKDWYRGIYRDGFRAGYDAGYRDTDFSWRTR